MWALKTWSQPTTARTIEARTFMGEKLQLSCKLFVVESFPGKKLALVARSARLRGCSICKHGVACMLQFSGLPSAG